MLHLGTGHFPGFAAPSSYAYTLSGRAGEAIRLLEQAVQQAVSRRTITYRVRFVTWLGEAYRQAGQLDQARQLVGCALQRSRDRQERGHEARALWLLGDIVAQHRPLPTELAEDRYRQPLALAEALGMRPLLAHCDLSIGTLYARMGWKAQAYVALSGTLELYCAMQMTLPPQRIKPSAPYWGPMALKRRRKRSVVDMPSLPLAWW
jgi:tetratricopeptide (TPR) repeat protein